MKKRRRPEESDRRRPVVDLNLTGEVKGQSAARRAGCASLISRAFLNLLLVGLLLAGLG